jgi:choline dehydrogenase-like flavoprotein
MPDTPDGNADTDVMARAVYDIIQLFKTDPALSISFGPGSPSHPHLNPDSLADVRTYVTSPSPVDNVFYSRLIINHFGGTARLTDGPGGVDPETLIVRGTENVAVADASLIPRVPTAHPVGTIMAVADRAADILAGRWQI